VALKRFKKKQGTGNFSKLSNVPKRGRESPLRADPGSRDELWKRYLRPKGRAAHDQERWARKFEVLTPINTRPGTDRRRGEAENILLSGRGNGAELKGKPTCTKSLVIRCKHPEKAIRS